ncbi:hypothetical protein PIB30_005296 [Stylosanthes scabra]|uniref:Uncharacterized protein n=1 Tax=Stylosanthes scabra TaxID=79078 RepID=A0ABU6U3S5_9FABA|nr:hypothetical protein [Stylosanthes scabra]
MLTVFADVAPKRNDMERMSPLRVVIKNGDISAPYNLTKRRRLARRGYKQLLHGLGDNSTSSCKPLESSGDLPVVPCGLIAWSLFNDTFKFSSGSTKLKVNRKNIAQIMATRQQLWQCSTTTIHESYKKWQSKRATSFYFHANS